MIIRIIAGTRSIEIAEASDFRAFAVRIEGSFEDRSVQDELLGRAAVRHDHEHAWIAERWLRERPALEGETWWQEGLTKMIASVQRFGWIDQTNQSIRAHIEYVA